MAIGQADISPLLAGERNVSQSQQFLAGNLINLGQQITQSISQNNMRNEAQQMAPLLAQQYQDAFKNLQSGQVGTGMGQIAQITAAASRNPLLANMTHQMNTITDNIVNNQAQDRRQAENFKQQYGLEWYRQYGQQQAQTAMADRAVTEQKAAEDRQDIREKSRDARQDERIDAQMYNEYSKVHSTWANQMQAYKQNPELFNGEAPVEPEMPAFVSDKFQKLYPNKASSPEEHFDQVKQNPVSQPNPQVIQQSQSNAQQIQQSGVGTKTFDIGGQVADLIGGNISFPAPQGKTVSRTGNSKTGEIHTTVTEKDLSGENEKLKSIYQPAIKAASELSNNPDLVKFIKGPDGKGNLLSSNIGVEGVTVDDNGKVTGTTPIKGKYDGYTVYKIDKDGNKQYYSGVIKKGRIYDDKGPFVLDKDQVAPIAILKSLPETAVALGGTLKTSDGEQPQGTQLQAAPSQQAGPQIDISKIPPKAVEMLKQAPNTRDHFDKIFGEGAASAILGK